MHDENIKNTAQQGHYTVQELAKLAGTNRRTLQHYDDIGLLKPERTTANNYRRYTRDDILQLQQIMFFRELDFSLNEIGKILNSPNFDMKKALGDHRTLIGLRRKRLDNLIKTIDETIQRLDSEKNLKNHNNQTCMTDKDLYASFSKEEEQTYAAEAKERWGHTEAYKRSQERYGKMSKSQKDAAAKSSHDLMIEIAECFKSGMPAAGKEMQELIARHYEGLRTFYDPNPEMYRGLGEMYVADPRFTAFYDKYAEGLAPYMRDAMIAYADTYADSKNAL
jgi:DNA-binding transcriptional MerR regulator